MMLAAGALLMLGGGLTAAGILWPGLYTSASSS